MAGGTVRRGTVSFAGSLRMFAMRIVSGDVRVAGGTRRLGYAFRMRILLMLGMTGRTTHVRMCMPFDLVADIHVAREAKLVIGRLCSRGRLRGASGLPIAGARYQSHHDPCQSHERS